MRPSELRPELHAALDAWFDKALAHGPCDRFQDARAMAGALYDAVRATESAAVENATAAAGAPHPTLSELALPLRRLRRSRASALLALALAAATSLFVWRSGGPAVQEANASMSTEVTEASTRSAQFEQSDVDAALHMGGERQPATARAEPTSAVDPTVVFSESEACRLIEADPAVLAPAIRAILVTTPSNATAQP